jgi:hypothetical protein
MRRLLAGLALMTLAGCIVAETRPPPPGGATQPVTEVQPPPAPPPAQFTEADNARWMQALRLDLALPQRNFAQGQPVLAQLMMSNASGQPVPVSSLEAVDAQLTLAGPHGQTSCRPALQQGATGSVYTLAPRQRLAQNLDVTGRCGALEAGEYNLTATIGLPGPWSVGAQGQLVARNSFRVEKPRQAALALVLQPGPESVLGQPAFVQVTVSNYGDAPARVPSNDAGLALEATDELGRPVRCAPPQAAGYPRDVFPGQSFNVRIDAAQRCELTQPGSFSIAAVIEAAGQPVRSNAVAIVRRAPAPRATLQLSANAWTRYEPGRGLPIEIRLVNQGPDAIYVYGFAPELVHVEAFGDGRPLPCHDEGRPNPGEYNRYQLVRPGSTLTGRIDLERQCQLVGQHITARLSYNAGPEFAGGSWNLQSWTGAVSAPAVEIERVAPAPQPPHISVSFAPTAEGRAGQPILVNVAVRSDGAVPATVVAPREDAVSVVSATDMAGRVVSCDPRGREFGPPETLPPGGARNFALDLSQRCSFPGPGEYRVRLSYRTAPQGVALPVAADGSVTVRVDPGFVPPPPPPTPAHVSVTFSPTRLDTMPGRPAQVNVTVSNDGRSPADVDQPREGLVSIEVRDAYGRPVRCNNYGPGAPQPVRLQIGQSTGFTFDLNGRCTLPGPGEYRVGLRYQSAPRAGTMPLAQLGSVQLVVATNAPPPPPPPPPPSGQPHVSVNFPNSVLAAPGQPAMVSIGFIDDGTAPADLDAPRPAFVRINLRDANGRFVGCSGPGGLGAPQPERLVPGQRTGFDLDLAQFCRFPGPGSYRAELNYESPARQGLLRVAGTAVVAITVGGNAPPPPPPPPQGQVSVRFPDVLDSGKHDEAVMHVVFRNEGRAPATINGPDPAYLTIEGAREKHGRGEEHPLDCERLNVSTGPVTLYPGQTRTLDVDLSRVCRLHHGEYDLRLRYQSPAPPNGVPVFAQGATELRIGH